MQYFKFTDAGDRRTSVIIPYERLYAEVGVDEDGKEVVRVAALGLGGTLHRAGDVEASEPRMIQVAESAMKLEAMMNRIGDIICAKTVESKVK